MRKYFLIFVLLIGTAAYAVDPMATDYTYRQCEGSLTPYPPEINPAVYPDSLTPVYINHIGRHGSRYPASSANCRKLQSALLRADSLGTITPTGRQLAKLNDYIIEQSENRWGSLDSLGMAEQRAIASRMFFNYGTLFANEAIVNAISSYSPRSMMSMYTFLHQLDRLNNHITVTTTTGRVNSTYVRPFDTDTAYIAYRKAQGWNPTYNDFFAQNCPTAPIKRVLGERYAFADESEAQDLAITEYYVIAGCSAMGVDPNASRFFTKEEMNALWGCFNLRQYLMYSSSTLTSAPADMAAHLLRDIIETTDKAATGKATEVATLRFGHAESLMPLLSLMHLRGCYYMTNYFDTVGLHWQDFNIVPMAANLQIVLFRSASGSYYVRVDLNEVPIPLQPGDSTLYTPWETAKNYLSRCLPLYIF